MESAAAENGTRALSVVAGGVKKGAHEGVGSLVIGLSARFAVWPWPPGERTRQRELLVEWHIQYKRDDVEAAAHFDEKV